MKGSLPGAAREPDLLRDGAQPDRSPGLLDRRSRRGCAARSGRRRSLGRTKERPRPCGRGLRASANREADLRLATLRPTRRRCGLPRKALVPSCIPESGGMGIFHPEAPALRPGPFCVGKPGSGHSARDFAAYTPSMRIAEEGACPFLHPRKRRIGGIFHPKAPALRPGPQPVEKGHRKVAFFLIGDSRIEGKNAV